MATTMNISLPETMKVFVEERIERDGYGSVSEYIRDLIREDLKKKEEEKLEKLLLSRLESTADFSIKEVKEELTKRVNKRKNR